eukprot:6185411-Pleurochrysis_carterae.AAC.1
MGARGTGCRRQDVKRSSTQTASEEDRKGEQVRRRESGDGTERKGRRGKGVEGNLGKDAVEARKGLGGKSWKEGRGGGSDRDEGEGGCEGGGAVTPRCACWRSSLPPQAGAFRRDGASREVGERLKGRGKKDVQTRARVAYESEDETATLSAILRDVQARLCRLQGKTTARCSISMLEMACNFVQPRVSRRGSNSNHRLAKPISSLSHMAYGMQREVAATRGRACLVICSCARRAPRLSAGTMSLFQ